MAAVDGTGTTITFGTSNYAAQLISVDGPSMTRETIESSHMGTTGQKTFIPTTLSDSGELSVEFELLTPTQGVDPDSQEMIDQAAETITINWGGLGAGHTWSVNGFMTAFSPSSSMGERMTASATIKLSGAVALV